jgi:nucleobase:cation symporter-1, NCS1 family
MIPQFHDMPNTLPESAGTTTQRLIGFILYSILLFGVVVTVPPAKIRKLLYPAFFIILATFLSILIWALASNGGTGNLISSPVPMTNSMRAFRMIQCISSVGGSYGGAAERFSDWSRFSKTRHATTGANLIALPLTITFSATIGVLITTATYNMFGTLLWNPLELLTHIQATSYTPAARAGTFFAGLGLLLTQS